MGKCQMIKIARQICRMLFELEQARGEEGGQVESLEVSNLI